MTDCTNTTTRQMSKDEQGRESSRQFMRFTPPVSISAPLPPGPRGLVQANSARRLQRDPLDFLRTLARDHGDVARFRFYAYPITFINHPDAIKRVLQDHQANYNKDVIDYRLLRWLGGNGLIVNDGASWLRQRRLMQPAFHRARIAGLGAMMTRATLAMLEGWEALASDGATLDIAEEMMRLSLRIVAEALFRADMDVDIEQFEQAFGVFNAAVLQLLYEPWRFLPGAPSSPWRRLQAARRTLSATAERMIAQRRRQQGDQLGDQDDLLAMLLSARDAETGEGMDDRQISAEVLTLLLAGHETTALALAWTWYLLDTHPEVEQRLHTELRDALGDNKPTVDDLPHLPYLRMTLEETLRLYPPAWSFLRHAVAADTLGGYRVPKRALVLISPYTMHRHPAFWERPEAYDPERFTPDRSVSRPRFAYVPFGGGPRQCIGNSFALTEAQLVLATVAQHYRLRMVPGQVVEPEPLMTLRLRHGLRMRLEHRH
jgi:cytochrome P450